MSGNRSDYKIGELSDDTLVIADRRGIDGEDQVSGFERYQFADRTVSRDELFNEAPFAIKLDGGSVSESTEAGTVVGQLYTGDADRDDSHTYELVDAKGNAVKDANFEIKDNAIVVRDGSLLDFESSSQQTLFVKTTDQSGASHVEQFTIKVEDANEAPTAVTVLLSTSEDVPVIVRLSGLDVDARDSIALVRIDQLPRTGSFS